MKNRGKKQEPMSDEVLKKKAIKQVFIVIIAGLLMIAADFLAASENEIGIVEKNGKLYMIRPEKGGAASHISFLVEVPGKKQMREQKVEITLEPFGKPVSGRKKTKKVDEELAENEHVEYEIRQIANGFNDNRMSKMVELPARLKSGERITWKEKRDTNSVAIAMCMVLMIPFIFMTYLNPMKKRKKEEHESVIRQLPEFINKIVLLLNAGLVLNSAFEIAIAESLQFKKNDEDYFCRKLKEMYVSMQNTNSSINEELRKFAKENGTKELMRISNIVSDNVNKGVELTDKLRRESEILWLNRKKNCEEKGRLAETKLTLPLMIFLMVLIVITVAPALMEL